MARAGFRPTRPIIEIADIFRRLGEDYAHTHAAHLGRVERRVMSCYGMPDGGARRPCRSLRRLRRLADRIQLLPQSPLPKVPGQARAKWVADRQAELLPVPYFHLVFTLPAPIAEIAFQNKAAVYAILFRAAADAMTALAANPRRLGARIGGLAVLHTWGQALTHHPHIHCVVPGGGLSSDGSRLMAGGRTSFSRSSRSPGCSGASFSNACKRFSRPEC